jgi:gamma-glutamyltranspeptidase/glutathione hydrolase
LHAAWSARQRLAANLVAGARHTNHFCVADDEGALVSLTFTHGPLWFGSGLVAPGTGVVLNAGANLFARSLADGTIFPQTNLTPVIVACGNGARHAIGSPGGMRIPAIVLQMVVDVVGYGLPLSKAIALPRMSVSPDGALEAEPDLAAAAPSARPVEQIKVRDYYGPASALSLSTTGDPAAACDPRFSSAVIEASLAGPND